MAKTGISAIRKKVSKFGTVRMFEGIFVRNQKSEISRG
jgi:hypothetical protein